MNSENNSAINDVTNSDVATYTGSIVVENEVISSEPKPVEATPSENSEKVSEKKEFGFINIKEIIIDDTYFGRVDTDTQLYDVYLDDYLAGRNLPPIQVERKTKKLVDGVHRLEAQKRLDNMCKDGKYKREDFPNAFYGELTKVEFIDIPERIEPRLVAVNCNRTHGKKASLADIKAAVNYQFKKVPDFTFEELAAFFCVTEKTAKSYAADILKDRTKYIKEYAFRARADGKTQEQIAKDLQEEHPTWTGTSQSTISNILSNKIFKRKTNKTVITKNETDLDTNFVQDTPIVTDEEKPLEASVNSTPIDSESDSLISEESTDSIVPENQIFIECMKVLKDAEETIIDRVKFFSGAEVKEILERIQALGNNIENKALDLKVID